MKTSLSSATPGAPVLSGQRDLWCSGQDSRPTRAIRTFKRVTGLPAEHLDKTLCYLLKNNCLEVTHLEQVPTHLRRAHPPSKAHVPRGRQDSSDSWEVLVNWKVLEKFCCNIKYNQTTIPSTCKWRLWNDSEGRSATCTMIRHCVIFCSTI